MTKVLSRQGPGRSRHGDVAQGGATQVGVRESDARDPRRDRLLLNLSAVARVLPEGKAGLAKECEVERATWFVSNMVELVFFVFYVLSLRVPCCAKEAGLISP